jgi:hypothetical protein
VTATTEQAADHGDAKNNFINYFWSCIPAGMFAGKASALFWDDLMFSARMADLRGDDFQQAKCVALAVAIPVLAGAAKYALVWGTPKALGMLGTIAIKVGTPILDALSAVIDKWSTPETQETLQGILQKAREIQVKEGPDAQSWIVLDPRSGGSITLKSEAEYKDFIKEARQAGFSSHEIVTRDGQVVATTRNALGRLDSGVTGHPSIEVVDGGEVNPRGGRKAWHLDGRPSSEGEILVLRREDPDAAADAEPSLSV